MNVGDCAGVNRRFPAQVRPDRLAITAEVIGDGGYRPTPLTLSCLSSQESKGSKNGLSLQGER